MMREDSSERGVKDWGLLELMICFWSLLTISYNLLICLYFSLIVSCILLHATSFLVIIADSSSFFWLFCFSCYSRAPILSWCYFNKTYNFDFSSSRRSLLPLRCLMVSAIYFLSSVQPLALHVSFGMLYSTVFRCSYELYVILWNLLVLILFLFPSFKFSLLFYLDTLAETEASWQVLTIGMYRTATWSFSKLDFLRLSRHAFPLNLRLMSWWTSCLPQMEVLSELTQTRFIRLWLTLRVDYIFFRFGK